MGKKLKHGKLGLYLDFYPHVKKHVDIQKETRRQHLWLYIHERPKTKAEREHNKETKMPGENIRAQRQPELQADVYGFISTRCKQENFLEFFRQKKSRECYAEYHARGEQSAPAFAAGCRIFD